MNVHRTRLLRNGLVFFVIFSLFVVSMGGCCLSCSKSRNYKAYTQRHGRVLRTGKLKAGTKASQKSANETTKLPKSENDTDTEKMK